MPKPDQPDDSKIILYQTEDQQTRLEVRFQGQEFWLSLNQVAELFERDKSVISRHLKNIFTEGELDAGATVAKSATVQSEGTRTVKRVIEYYSLPVVLAVGYRVNSHRGTQFRQWATARLQEFLVKGFVMDDERLKNPPGPGQEDYFEELLARIRDIRSSERVFYRKVLDIYATSVDYDPAAEASQRFFAVVQNKMHWAAHGHTAAEIVHERADASKPRMGLTHTRPGGVVRKTDVSIAKNYLNAEELETLNRVVNAYLEFAELQAKARKPMTMAAWIAKLDDFLRLSDRELLTHAGKISAEAAKAKAELEYDRFRTLEDAKPRAVDADFDAAVEKLKKLPRKKD
jgi:hypothetical protein